MASSERSLWQHWPALILGVAVALVFIAALVVFEVKETEYAVVMTFGKPVEEVPGKIKEYPPGPHWKLPYPIQTVWTHDNRLQCYELKKGQIEQNQTKDEYQVIVSTYVLWQVGDPGTFLKAVNTTAEAENKLDDVVRNARSSVMGQHNLTELINIDAKKVKITEIETEILALIQDVAAKKYGINVTMVGFRHLGFPEQVTNKVFDRMREERKRKSEKYLAEGKRDAQLIRSETDLQASSKLVQAEAEAKSIRAEGDRKAAEFYAVFGKNPELAAFLRKLESLRQTVTEKTTLVLDTRTPPYDLLLPGATDLGKKTPAPADAAQGK